jgi:hypothetical protein
MTALLAMGFGILGTAVGVLIGGLALEMVLMVMRRSLTPAPTGSDVAQAGKAVVIQFKAPEGSAGMVELAKEAA